MDPVTLIVTALAAGAATGAGDTAARAVRDAYAGLKALLLRKAAEEPAAEMVLVQHEDAPEVWQAPVTKLITDSGAATDAEILAAAFEVLRRADPSGVSAGTYTITASGERSIAAHTIQGGASTGDTHSD